MIKIEMEKNKIEFVIGAFEDLGIKRFNFNDLEAIGIDEENKLIRLNFKSEIHKITANEEGLNFYKIFSDYLYWKNKEAYSRMTSNK